MLKTVFLCGLNLPTIPTSQIIELIIRVKCVKVTRQPRWWLVGVAPKCKKPKMLSDKTWKIRGSFVALNSKVFVTKSPKKGTLFPKKGLMPFKLRII